MVANEGNGALIPEEGAGTEGTGMGGAPALERDCSSFARRFYSSCNKGWRSWSSLTTAPRLNGSLPTSPGIPTRIEKTKSRPMITNAKIHWNATTWVRN